MRAIDSSARIVANLERGKRVPEPLLGYCVVRVVPDTKTAGGVIVDIHGSDSESTEARSDRNRFTLAATSGRFLTPSGAIVEHGARVGDEVLCRVGTQSPPAHWADDPDLRVLALVDVIAVHRAKAAEGAQ
jgi:hypothetical protein